MEVIHSGLAAEAWRITRFADEAVEISKVSTETRVWQTPTMVAKWYPIEFRESWAQAERDIAGTNLHPAIVPLRSLVRCLDGDIHLYDRIGGQNLEEVRRRFWRLPAAERITAVLTIIDALSAVCQAGFTVVDWYDGNMHYDFDRRQIWLFDWDLCRPGGSFVLEMDSNYGSSRLMAPEEYVRGSQIDEATLVFNLGRFATIYLAELAEGIGEVLARATHPTRSRRFQTAQEFRIALSDALASVS